MDEAAERGLRAELARKQSEARRSIHHGAVMILSIPAVVILALCAAIVIGWNGGLIAILITVAYTAIAGIAGSALLVSGAVEHRGYSRQLRALDEIRKLPEARLLR